MVCFRTRKKLKETFSPVITIYQKILTLDCLTAKGTAIININPSVIQEFLQQQCTFSSQQIYIFTDEWTLLASSDKELPQENAAKLEKSVSAVFAEKKAAENSIHVNEKGYTISMTKDDAAPFIYVSVISNRQLYSMPAKLLDITTILVILSAIIALWLSASYSKNITRNIHSIMDIFHAAQNGEPLPPAPSVSTDEQSYIITNLISTFIKQKYLSVQLSEKNYHAKVLELAALQSQINPHFLFNTLETIRLKSFHLTDGPNDISFLIENLSDIMRYTLSPNTFLQFVRDLFYFLLFCFCVCHMVISPFLP
ncbi:MAG: histidine kinase [Eubacterium sp.]|jgi:two-component system sensor histidine kinase YesM|nr:histidine kinase [Lachnospiraceae bacterium]MCI9125499.1 histidine kinase [Eubacterium sp.]